MVTIPNIFKGAAMDLPLALKKQTEALDMEIENLDKNKINTSRTRAEGEERFGAGERMIFWKLRQARYYRGCQYAQQ